LAFLLACVLVAYLAIVARLWSEQVVGGAEREKEIARQSIRRVRKPAIRGRILTADGVVLAENRPEFNVVFHLSEMRKPGPGKRTIEHVIASVERVAEAIGRTNPLTEEKIRWHINHRPALPMTIFPALDQRELASASEMVPPVKGMEITTTPTRRYPMGRVACHLLGYVRKQSPDKAGDKGDYFYYLPDEVGVRGVEKVFDEFVSTSPMPVSGLRGAPGRSLFRVDSIGYVYEPIGRVIPAKVGRDVVLTLNFKAQRIAEKLLEGKRGAFVLLDASTGAVLAMASSPGYDLSHFMPRLPSSYWKQLRREDSGNPLLNRALQCCYEPGSIIKPLVALALLESGMPTSEVVTCEGRSYIGKNRKPIKCWAWRSGGHGSLGVVGALEQSCNVFFIEEGRVLGMEKIADTMASFGVGKKTGFELPNKKGLAPSRPGKFMRTGVRWTEFDTALLCIGQGYINITPLQAALIAATIANGGTLWRPFILGKALDSSGNTIFATKPQAKAELRIGPEYLAPVREGMFKVVHGVHGSGKNADTRKIKIYGKTGTAEKGSGANRRKNTWFMGFGTKDGKTYAFAVLVENGQSGGHTCAPIVRKFFDAYLP
jgi:penicillin-binding protein 2